MSGGEGLREKLFISFSNIEQLEKAITLVHLAAVHHLAAAAVKLLHVNIKIQMSLQIETFFKQNASHTV